MRILQCSHLFPPESHGGTQSYVSALVDALTASGEEVLVLTGSPNLERRGEIGRDTRGGAEVLRLYRDALGESFSADVGAPGLETRVGALLDELAPDLIHVHHWNGLVWNLVAQAESRGIPALVTLHDLYTTCGRFFRMPNAREFCSPEVSFEDCGRCISSDVGGQDPLLLAQVLGERFRRYQDELSRARAVLCVSEAQRDLLESIPGFGQHDIRVLPIGIPGSFQAAARRAEDGLLADDDRPLRLVNWGGLDPRKGVHVLVEALGRVRRPAAFELDLFGGGLGGSYHEELIALAGDLKVRFHGRYEEDELLNFGRRFDLAVFPFLAFETYGLVVDEALRSGLAVLTSAHGAPPERLGERGLVTAPGDVAALAHMLDELESDREQIRALAAGPHRAGDFEGHFAEVKALYRSILGA
jgi:glycosyltransferase involved in cell wall biosynthesis